MRGLQQRGKIPADLRDSGINLLNCVRVWTRLVIVIKCLQQIQISAGLRRDALDRHRLIWTQRLP